MSENFRIRDVLTKPRVAAALMLSGLAIAGCGNTRSADSETVGTCGQHDYSKAESSHPVTSLTQTLDTAKNDVITLQQRALRAGGDINLPRYSSRFSSVVEIQAAQDNLQLLFDRTSWIGGPRVDHVNFPISGNTAHISEGAIACFDDNDKLVANGTYTTLQQYVHQTAALSK